MSEENIQSLDRVKVSVNNMIEKAEKDPDFGKFKYYVNTTWEGGTLCKNQIRRAHKLLVDEPAAFGGDDLSASPVELVLVALGSCQQIMYSALASVRDIPLEECEVTLKAKLDVRGLLGINESMNVFPGFSDISYETKLKSSAEKEKLEQLVEDVENQCPVMDMLTRNVKINGTTQINGDVFDQKHIDSSDSLLERIISKFKRKSG
ncbi:OsmC family protein [Winogradskyella sp.]|uniref:OsmC family protein n=1 Tax=Winogradskyella sp. TaxID=1883156 RepID=UPI002635DFEE|nr:OsmC family protein [Winogradskyella sp.]